jgi:hypothetical protein
MPRTAEDVENYLLQLDRRFDNDGGTYVINEGEGKPPIAIHVSPPVVAIRVSIGAVPQDQARQPALFRKLLEYNTTDLMHTAYGISGETIVLSASLELENLDLNELEAALSDVDLALDKHIGKLKEMAQG